MDLANVKYWEHPSKTNCVFVEERDSPLISIDLVLMNESANTRITLSEF